MKIELRKLETLKAEGIEQIASVVKSVFYTTYYHVVKIDDIIANDCKWIPAAHVQFASGAHGSYGISGKSIDWEKTIKLRNLKTY
jgi:hypothetical protein